MLRKTDIYLDRLQALKETFPMIREKVKEGKVDLNRFVTECGTGHCILGWWATTQRANDDEWRWDANCSLMIPMWKGLNGLAASKVYFGISDFHAALLFGRQLDSSDTITHREQMLDELIDERAR